MRSGITWHCCMTTVLTYRVHLLVMTNCRVLIWTNVCSCVWSFKGHKTIAQPTRGVFDHANGSRGPERIAETPNTEDDVQVANHSSGCSCGLTASQIKPLTRGSLPPKVASLVLDHWAAHTRFVTFSDLAVLNGKTVFHLSLGKRSFFYGDLSIDFEKVFIPVWKRLGWLVRHDLWETGEPCKIKCGQGKKKVMNCQWNPSVQHGAHRTNKENRLRTQSCVSRAHQGLVDSQHAEHSKAARQRRIKACPPWPAPGTASRTQWRHCHEALSWKSRVYWSIRKKVRKLLNIHACPSFSLDSSLQTRELSVHSRHVLGNSPPPGAQDSANPLLVCFPGTLKNDAGVLLASELVLHHSGGVPAHMCGDGLPVGHSIWPLAIGCQVQTELAPHVRILRLC